MILPDGILFEKVVSGVITNENDLRALIDGSLSGQKEAESKNSAPRVEDLLDSILLCGAFELLAHHDIDAPIIISDYLEVTHAFYEGSEAKLVNGVLDRIKNQLRGA